MTAPTVAFATLGCRLNQVDTQELQGTLEARGYRTVPSAEGADVVIVNTCTVTARADFSDRQAIRRVGRLNPHARIVVTGCWAQVNPDAVAGVSGVDLVVGNGDKPRLPDLLERLLARERLDTPETHVAGLATARALPAMPLGRATGRSRAFLKLQDGCQHRCAFCVVPLARGVSRSREIAAVLDQARGLVDSGHPELVLTGVDLGYYGADLAPRTTLAALLRSLAEIPGLRWIRMSSLLPAYFTPDLLDVVTGSPLIAPHLHVPLQSGSDPTLRRMRRPYTVAMYRRLVERLATAIPRLGLGADVIVGFPGESDADFEQTMAVIDGLPLTYLHVFPYSDRPGTEASGLDGHLAASVITERGRRLRALGRAKNLAFRRGLVGGTEDVLVLETRDRASGRLVGLTGNYVEVAFAGSDDLMGRMARVRVTEATPAGTVGVRE
ncbi:MAG TPA: tRNA (N(6)-L-threonylcarbamoyladenosine(37)-C(2))-methylthiotransferase MtaB [Candidatus Acidoferrum sp.]|nr:tRNA (N(6)-L-threonylcarbamoyladenosine(37)-C(2))-methylthiotransferase MtaB [Candidatus Acidoferrum sp.]